MSQTDAAAAHFADPAAAARAVIDANAYMTLATADAQGRPWATPVWFAHDGYGAFIWLSKPGARHSLNLSARPQVAIVIFDSSVPIGGAQAVYVEAEAAQVEAGGLEPALATYNRRSQEQGAGVWTAAQATGDARHRLYRAVASAHYLLDEHDERLPLTL